MQPSEATNGNAATGASQNIVFQFNAIVTQGSSVYDYNNYYYYIFIIKFNI